MVKNLLGIALCVITAVMTGCVADDMDRIPEAQALIRSGEAECVLIRDGTIHAQENGRGVNPLLSIYETYGDRMNGGIIVDKVVGRAAAAIAICGGVRYVHGEIMSEDAVVFLEEYGVGAGYTSLVPRILNRDRDGLCPLEQSVQGLDDPKQALEALKVKIASFQTE